MHDAFDHSAPYIKYVDCRHTAHVTLCSFYPPSKARIARINDDFYYVYSTEEFRPYSHGETGTKSDNVRSIKRAFNNLKKLINCNYEQPSFVRFITLTYAENMEDNKRIRKDFYRFMRRMKKRYGDFEYLYVKEQQGRGAWHLHCVFFFPSPAPWMDNEEVRSLWGQGFVNIQGFEDDINNLGNYLCAYLTDDKETSKKGARLCNYEAGVRLYNCSRGIQRPVVKTITYEQYLDMLNDDHVKELSVHDCDVDLPTGQKLDIRYKLFALDS